MDLKGIDHSESGKSFSVYLTAMAERVPIRLESRKCVFDIQGSPSRVKTKKWKQVKSRKDTIMGNNENP